MDAIQKFIEETDRNYKGDVDGFADAMLKEREK